MDFGYQPGGFGGDGGVLSYKIQSTSGNSFASFEPDGTNEFLTVKTSFSGGFGNIVEFLDDNDVKQLVITDEGVLQTPDRIALGIRATTVAIGTDITDLSLVDDESILIGDTGIPAQTVSRRNIFIGLGAGSGIAGGDHNIFIGNTAGFGITSGLENIGIGLNALEVVGAGGQNVAFGRYAGKTTAGNGGIFLGYHAGYYENLSDRLYISSLTNIEQADVATGRTRAIIYGVQSPTPSSQTLAFNAQVSVPYALTVGTNLAYTTSEGSFFGDGDTGHYESADDALNTIVGGIQAVRYTAASSHVIKKVEMHTGITASTTQTQGQQPLLSSYNEISVVANANDVVTMPPAAVGNVVTIINNGANALQIYPASGDDLGLGVDTSFSLNAGNKVTYEAHDSTNWN